MRNARPLPLFALLVLFSLTGCANKPAPEVAAKPLKRSGNEIVVAGQYFDIGTPVVLWTDPGGFDAYRTERRFAPWDEASFRATTQAATTRESLRDIGSPNRVNLRWKVLSPAELEIARAGMPLSLLQDKVDQFVIHYDVAGISANCFKTLHDVRGLSVQFMLDIDGTIYQTCDTKEACSHATKANHRSIGIEIANMGSYSSGEPEGYKEWFDKDEKGPFISIPARAKSMAKFVRTPNFVGRPARPELIEGQVQGRRQRQYDYTPEQYAALIKLTAGLCTVLPKIDCDYPRDENGQLITKALSDEQWDSYHGVLGHYHVQTNKSDPGPAFQWDYVIDNARKRMGLPPKSAAGKIRSDPTTQPTTRPTRVAEVAPDPKVELGLRLDRILHKLDKGDLHYVARVIDPTDGRELYAHDIDKPVMPASNGKIAVSAAALDRFGSSHTFKTYLANDGDDLWLIGTGDPACGDSRLSKVHGGTTVTMLDKWADALKAKGIERIKGNLYYYAGAFDGETIHPSWSRAFLTDWYAAPVTGLNFNDNCIDITVQPTSPGQPATFSVVPPTNNIKVTNGIVTREGDGPEAKIDREQEANIYTLSGAVAKETTLESKPVTDPAAFFADALRTHLASRGINIDGETKPADTPLGGSIVPPTDKIIAVHETTMVDAIGRINKQSQNLFAEDFCKYLGKQFRADHGVDEPGSWQAGSEAVHAFLKKLSIDDSQIVVADGSGLSRENRVTSRMISDLLVAMHKREDGEVFRKSMGEAGVDGTIGKRMKDLSGRVFAKTGYIGGVLSLIGYVKTDEGKWLVFSIIFNGIDGDVKPYEALQDEAVHLLAKWPKISG
jgi:PBP4 family serine-type D-alanyl-D-alanine carboxypeptidase